MRALIRRLRGGCCNSQGPCQCNADCPCRCNGCFCNDRF